MTAHECQYRVYYEDTDAGGIVFYPNYLKFAERGRTELLRSIGLTNSELAEKEGYFFVVRKLTAEYFRPARLDDMITVKTAMGVINNASFEMKQEIYIGETKLFAMDVTLVCVGKDVKPMRVPDGLRDKLAAFMAGT